MSAQTFQPMPDLTEDQRDALRADIEAHGIIVPVVVDQHGRVLDGHNRQAIAAELGIDCPVEVRHVADDDEAADLAVTLNCARRHLTQEQKRHLIRAELRRRISDSDRAIARRVGCSPTTVGTVRAEVRAEAEARTQEVRDLISQAATQTAHAALDLVRLGANLTGIIARADVARGQAADRLRHLNAEGKQAGARPEQVAAATAWTAAMCDWYVFTTMHNDLSDLAADLTDAGWEGCPRVLPQSELDELTDALFTDRASVQSGQSLAAANLRIAGTLMDADVIGGAR